MFSFFLLFLYTEADKALVETWISAVKCSTDELSSILNTCRNLSLAVLTKCRGTQWICSSKYLFFMQIFAGWEMWRNNSPWKESVAGKKIIQGVRGDLKSRIAATGYLYGLLTTQDLNWALWNFPVSQVAGYKVAGWELFHQSCWEWWTDNFFPAISQNA